MVTLDMVTQEDTLRPLIVLIDEALERFGSRDMVSSAEVLDFLLDLRLAAATTDPLEQLLEEESEPAGA